MARAHPDISGLTEWQPLARGGFSTVWQARQESLDRLVAVKVDHRTLSEDKERRRFLREAGAAGRLSGHAGIVTVHDAGILTDGRPYLVMDLCPGGSLTQWLKPQGRQSEQRIRDVGVRIADALAAAHARGVLHRDVKPANILIDAYDHPGLADFGLAALPEPGLELSVTLEGMTPAYAPTEVFYLKPPTAAGDVYSLAATLYALLEGKPPRWPDLGTPSLPELLERQRYPIERLPHVDDELMDVLLEALDDDPDRRPTAAEFRDRLAAVSFAGSGGAAPQLSGGRFAGAGAAALGTAAVAANDDDSDLGADGPQAGARAAGLDGADDGSGRSTGSGSGSDGAPPRRGSRRRLAAVLVGAAVVAALLIVGFFNWGPSTGTAVPPPVPAAPTSAATTVEANSPSPSPTEESPTPTPSPPEGFVDCSEQLGGQSYCVDPGEYECWTDLFGYADLPTVGTMQDCNQPHVYQTYAAGVLDKPVNMQSEFEARKEVRALCTEDNLDKVLASGKSLKDWQIIKLPPQVQIRSDNVFRCLFTNGERTGPVKLKVPK